MTQDGRFPGEDERQAGQQRPLELGADPGEHGAVGRQAQHDDDQVLDQVHEPAGQRSARPAT